jgi:hypothetical protein
VKSLQYPGIRVQQVKDAQTRAALSDLNSHTKALYEFVNSAISTDPVKGTLHVVQPIVIPAVSGDPTTTSTPGVVGQLVRGGPAGSTAQAIFMKTGSDGTDTGWTPLPTGSTGFANPTATIGLSAIPGSATTYMRSDAAPPLSQNIAPIWTAAHRHSSYVDYDTISAPITPNAGRARIYGATVSGISTLFMKRDDGSVVDLGNAVPSAVLGTGTSGRLPAWTGAHSQGDSHLADSGGSYVATIDTTLLAGDQYFYLQTPTALGGYLVTGGGTATYCPMFAGNGSEIVDSGYYPNGVNTNNWSVLWASGNVQLVVGTDVSHALTITRDSGTGLVTFDKTSGSPVGTFAFGKDVAVTGNLTATNLSGTNTGNETATSIRALGAFTLDATAQSLSATKRITIPTGASSALEFINTTTGNTSKILSFYNNAATPIEMVTIYGTTGGAAGSRSQVWRDTSGNERTFVRGTGVLVAWDGTNAGVPVQAATATTWSAVQTWGNLAHVHTGAETHSGVEVFSGGPSFTTVAPTSSIGFTFSTTAPTFNNVSPTFAATAAGTFQGFLWPVTNPATMKARMGMWSVDFSGIRDNIFVQSYNVDPLTGSRDDTSQHGFVISTECDYHYDATAGHERVEYHWSYTNPSGTSWRPFEFHVDVPSETSNWTVIPNNTNSGNNRYLEMFWPNIAFGRDTGYGSAYGDAGLSSFIYFKDRAATGFAQYGFKAEVVFDQTVSFAANDFFANTVKLDFTPTSKHSGHIKAYGMITPLAPGAGSAVDSLICFYTQDLRIDLLTDGQVFRAESQTVSNADQGNLVMAGVGYNHGHFKVGAWHIWDDNHGHLRGKNGTPTSDTDGTVIL